MAVPLSGARVLLRAVEQDDEPALVALFTEPDVARWWWGYDADRVQREIVGDEDPETTVYIIDVEGVVAGIVQYGEETEPDYRSASIDIAVRTAWHGTGVALDAIRTLARHLVDDLGHHHLTIDPAAANARAIACYAKVGFSPRGLVGARGWSPRPSTWRLRLTRLRFQICRSTGAATTEPGKPPIHHGNRSFSSQVKRVPPRQVRRMVKRPVPCTRPTWRIPMARPSDHSVTSMRSVRRKGPTLVSQSKVVPTPSRVGDV